MHCFTHITLFHCKCHRGMIGKCPFFPSELRDVVRYKRLSCITENLRTFSKTYKNGELTMENQTMNMDACQNGGTGRHSIAVGK